MGFFSSLKEGWYYAQHLREEEKESKAFSKKLEAQHNAICKQFNQDFDTFQTTQIQEGIDKGVDVSVYADKKFNFLQMEEICYGLTRGVDVQLYANPKWSHEQMSSIVCGLSDGLNGEFINELNPNMSSEDMHKIINQRVEENKFQQQSALQARKASEQANLQEYRNQEQQKMATKSMCGLDFGL